MDSINLNDEGKKQLAKLVEVKMKYNELDAERQNALKEIERVEKKYERALDNGPRKPVIKKELDQTKLEKNKIIEGIEKEQKSLLEEIEKLEKVVKPQFKESMEKTVKDIMATYEYEEDMNKRNEKIANIENEISDLESTIEKDQNKLNELNEKILVGDYSLLKEYSSVAKNISQNINNKDKKKNKLKNLKLAASKIVRKIDKNEELYDAYEMQISILNDDKEKGGIGFNEYFNNIIEALIAEKMLKQELAVEELIEKMLKQQLIAEKETPEEVTPVEEYLRKKEQSNEEGNNIIDVAEGENAVEKIAEDVEPFSKNLEYESELKKLKEKFDISTSDYEYYKSEINCNLEKGIKKEDFIKNLKAGSPNIREKDIEKISKIWDIIIQYENPKQGVIENNLEKLDSSDEKQTEIVIDQSTSQSWDELLANLGFERVTTSDSSKDEGVQGDDEDVQGNDEEVQGNDENIGVNEITLDPNDYEEVPPKGEEEFEEPEIDTENIPSLVFKVLEKIYTDKVIADIEEYLKNDFEETTKLTGKKTLRQKYDEFRMRYDYRRRQGESRLSSTRKIKYETLKNLENKNIKDEIEADLTRLKEGEPVQTRVAKKYLKDARKRMAQELFEYKSCKYELGLTGYDKKIDMLNEYYDDVSSLNEKNDGFTILFSKGESYVDENGNFCKVENKKGEKHYVTYESVKEQLRATIQAVEKEKENAKEDEEREEDLAK